MNKKLINVFIFLFIFYCGTYSSESSLRRRYHGADLDLPETECSMQIKGAEISDVLRAFGQEYNLNLVISSDITGKIDLMLSNISIKDAFLSILKNNDLGYIKEGDVYCILPMATIREQKTLQTESIPMDTRIFRLKNISVQRVESAVKGLGSKREGTCVEIEKQTNSVIVKDTPNVLEDMSNLLVQLDIKEVSHIQPLQTSIIETKFIKAEDIGKNIREILSSEGKLEINSQTNSLIISDVPANINHITSLIHQLDTPRHQIVIEARIVETTKNFSQELGIQWGGHYVDGPPSNKAFPQVTVTGNSGPNSESGYAVNLPAGINLDYYGGIGVSLGHLKNKFLLDVKLSAMEYNGEGKILSTPKVVTMDNIMAVIEGGSRIPYLTYDITDGEREMTVEYQDVLTRLEVTPHVINLNEKKKKIKMEISAIKENADFTTTVQGYPIIDKSSAETELIVEDGETAVIGGLYSTEVNESKRGLPWFANLPFIGWLFRSKYNRSAYDELLIFITPHIIKNNDIAQQ
ncbi:MAG: secretin N-terminal domain-containing protein [bacterium]